MSSSGGHRSSTSAFDPSVKAVDSGAKSFGFSAEAEPDEDYDYEEMEIEEEVEVDEDENKRKSVLTAGLGPRRGVSEIGVSNSPINAANKRSMHPKTRVPSEFDKVVGNTADHKCFGLLPEGPIRNVVLDGGHQNFRGYAIMSDHCQTEVHAGNYKDINRTQEARRVNAEFQSKDCSFDFTAPSKKLVDVKDAQVPPCNGRDVSSKVSAKGESCIESKHVSDSKEMGEQLDMQSLDGVNKCSSSFLAPTIMPRSLSPDAEFQDRAKRPAIMCKFFAKGQCKRGSICKFVHKGDNGGNTSHKIGGDVASEKCGQQFDRGSQDLIESPSSANGSRITSDRHVVGGSSSSLKHSQLERGLAGFGIGVSVSSHSSSMFSYHRSVEEASLNRSQNMFNDHNAPGFGYSLNQYHLRNHFSSHSYLRQDHFGDHKLLISQRPDDAFRSSLVQNPFPSSSVGTERSYHAGISRESLISNGYKSKFIPHNWEPSAPFRSSFSIPFLSTSAPGTLCDTIHDSIEQPEEKNISVKPSLGVGLLFEDASDSRNADKGQNYGREKDITACEAESVATSVTDPENRTSVAKDGSYFDALMNIGKVSRSGVEGDREQQNDTLRHRIELKVDGWKNSKIDLDNAEHEDRHRDSKSVKNFRAALIEFVKELMKPVWHEGHLTKDAYKIIVQRVENKVTNSLQVANLIPSTSEHVKQYLSSSRTKILNLIEAYADKYRKHVSNKALI